jgi:HEAT repeat protein
MVRTILIITTLLLMTCGMPPLQKAQAILQQGIADDSEIIQVNAAKGLLLAGDIQGLEKVYEILQGDDKNTIAAALTALHDVGDTTYSPVLVAFTTHSDPLIRSEAYKLVSIMPHPECLDVLRRGTQDKVAKIRKISYQGLANFCDKNTLYRGLRDTDPLVRIAAAQSLAECGEPDLENFIKNEMKVRNIDIWTEGVVALAEIGDTSAIPFFRDSLALVDDVPMDMRLAAAEALLILNNEDAALVLKEGIESSNPFIRVRAVHILKEHPFPEGNELLTIAAEDEYINVSVVAVEALGAQRTKKYQEVFIHLLDAPNPLVKIAAAAAFLRSK